MAGGNDEVLQRFAQLLSTQILGATASEVNGTGDKVKTVNRIVLNHRTESGDEDENCDDEQGSSHPDAEGDDDDSLPGLTCEIKNVYQKFDKNNRVVWVNEYPDDL